VIAATDGVEDDTTEGDNGERVPGTVVEEYWKERESLLESGREDCVY
jgi:hypothetical protein